MWGFAKAHGTLNDFVLLSDPDGELDLTPERVRFLCDRRAGIGGDGVLRVVRARHVPEAANQDPDLWFMDYRNADGSLAEMCGNGLRVFTRFLVEQGLAEPGVVSVLTRAGLRTGELLPDGRVRVSMGTPRAEPGRVQVQVGRRRWDATAINVGNPHAVALLGPDDDLGALDLTRAPVCEPPGRFPDGVNVEFITLTGPHRVRMRVFERGVGETASCGTGVVASALKAALTGGAGATNYTVEVIGGILEVDLSGAEAALTGPAVIVARGEVEVPA